MEKLSLYDFLSILLPGAILTLFIKMIMLSFGYQLDMTENDQYFALTLYLSSSLFLGSIINSVTSYLLGIYKLIHLYVPIEDIYMNLDEKMQIIPYFDEWMGKLPKEYSLHQRMEYVWAEIYYYLEANEKIRVPKNFQSFYFFFRNFFTLGLILLIPLITMMIVCWGDYFYLMLFVVNIIAMLLSVFAASKNRKKMAERMFWTYYSLNKNK